MLVARAERIRIPPTASRRDIDIGEMLAFRGREEEIIAAERTPATRLPTPEVPAALPAERDIRPARGAEARFGTILL